MLMNLLVIHTIHTHKRDIHEVYSKLCDFQITSWKREMSHWAINKPYLTQKVYCGAPPGAHSTSFYFQPALWVVPLIHDQGFTLSGSHVLLISCQ